MRNKSYDLVVIGAGSAGLTAAEFSAQLGQRVALVEKDRTGGDCTWTGCVPSKALLKVAKVAQEMRTAQRYGLAAFQPVVDLKAAMSYVKSTIHDVYQKESPEVLRAKGIDVYIGQARFLDPRTVAVDPPDSLSGSVNNDLGKLTARRFLIATGAKPFVPRIPGLEDTGYLTYESVWNLEALPRRLIVVGGGPVGCELAQAFCRLGSSITLVEAAPRIMLQDEPEAADLIARQLTQDGVNVQTSAPVERVWRDGQGIHVKAGAEEIIGDALLLSVGRTPNVSGLDLDKAGVSFKPGGIQVNQRLRTSQRHIYAAGDCAGGFQFTHYAAWQGFMALRNAFMLGFPVKAVLGKVPWVTFTDPEVAHVGLSESGAKEKFGESVRVSLWPMDKVDRAVTDGDASGFVKVVYRPGGKILGATIVAARAGEMIQEWNLAIDRSLKLRHVAESIHPYPTYSMANMQVAAQSTVAQALAGTSGRLARGLARLAR